MHIRFPRPRAHAGRRFALRVVLASTAVAIAVAGALTATAAVHHSTVAAATTATTVFHPVADARVDEAHPSANNGSDKRLGTDGDTRGRVESDLQFDVSGLSGTVVGATLRLYVPNDPTDDGPAVYPTSD